MGDGTLTRNSTHVSQNGDSRTCVVARRWPKASRRKIRSRFLPVVWATACYCDALQCCALDERRENGKTDLLDPRRWASDRCSNEIKRKGKSVMLACWKWNHNEDDHPANQRVSLRYAIAHEFTSSVLVDVLSRNAVYASYTRSQRKQEIVIVVTSSHNHKAVHGLLSAAVKGRRRIERLHRRSRA